MRRCQFALETLHNTLMARAGRETASPERIGATATKAVGYRVSRIKACVVVLAMLAGTAVLGGLNVGSAAATGATGQTPADDSASICTGVLVARLDGSVAALAPGGASCASSIVHGSLAGVHLNAPIIGIAALPGGNGYWLLASDGGVFAYGAAQFHGSTGSLHLNAPIVGMASTPDGNGYWLVASDGGIFSFGDAQFYGSTGGLKLNKPVVGMAADGATGGYWLVASDGGVFAFNAPFFGSMGGKPLNASMRFMTGTPDFGGYRLVASDGGVFDYGDAQFYGSAAAPGSSGWSALATTPDNGGYWLFAATGAASAPTFQAYGDASPNLSFVAGDGTSSALVVGAATVSYTVAPPNTVTPVAAGGIFTGVACAPASTTCVAVGGTQSGGALIERSTNGGADFSSDTLPIAAETMTAVTCPSTSLCVAVGGLGAMVSNDGGVTWSVVSTPATIGLTSVACENTTDCVAVGAMTSPTAESVYSTDGGRSWTTSPGAGSPALGVACLSDACVSAGETASTSTDGGVNWDTMFISPGGHRAADRRQLWPRRDDLPLRRAKSRRLGRLDAHGFPRRDHQQRHELRQSIERPPRLHGNPAGDLVRHRVQLRRRRAEPHRRWRRHRRVHSEQRDDLDALHRTARPGPRGPFAASHGNCVHVGVRLRAGLRHVLERGRLHHDECGSELDRIGGAIATHRRGAPANGRGGSLCSFAPEPGRWRAARSMRRRGGRSIPPPSPRWRTGSRRRPPFPCARAWDNYRREM